LNFNFKNIFNPCLYIFGGGGEAHIHKLPSSSFHQALSISLIPPLLHNHANTLSATSGGCHRSLLAPLFICLFFLTFRKARHFHCNPAIDNCFYKEKIYFSSTFTTCTFQKFTCILRIPKSRNIYKCLMNHFKHCFVT